MTRISVSIAALVLTAAAAAAALGEPATGATTGGTVIAAFPEKPDPGLRYVVYLHGRIVEEQGRRAVSPDFGAYQYDEIVAALARPGITVIGELRTKGTDAKTAAAHVVDGVRRLIAAGVPARNVTVVGASKGALIGKHASASLENREVGWVIMAGCSGSAAEELPIHGQVLSIFEASDEMGGTCAPLFAKSPDLARHDEVKIETGLGHGFLYKPLPEWLRPATAWIEGRKIER
jgi:hypothetical protein